MRVSEYGRRVRGSDSVPDGEMAAAVAVLPSNRPLGRGTVGRGTAVVRHNMRFRRVSSRDPKTVVAEILLKFLAHNVLRLVHAHSALVLNIDFYLF